MVVKSLTFEPGYITVTGDVGPPKRRNIADMLRAADIPIGLTYSQVGAITALADLLVVLIRTLIAKGVIDESFGEGDDLSIDLDHIIHAIEEMGGAYHDPDLTVS